MGDLHSWDITNEATYPAARLLEDIRHLIASGQREGPVLDYKVDISPKDNWPETVAAFANTFGGIILFGVEGEADQPRRLVGYDPKGVEMKTRLGSTIHSRVQPRPNFSIRIINLDTDPDREVAVLRVSEGTHPPYMHTRAGEHRIYVRTGAQKVEADYLQLNALYNKRANISPTPIVPTNDLHQRLAIKDPSDRNRPSEHWYRCIITPEGHGAARRLTRAVEQEFEYYVTQFFTVGSMGPDAVREQHISIYRHHNASGREEIFALTSDGTIGYATHACAKTDVSLLFSPWDFCAEVMSLLALATRVYDDAHYYGEASLTTTVVMPTARLINPGTFRGRILTGALFDPFPALINVNATAEARVTLNPWTDEPIRRAMEIIANDIARAAGTVLSPKFDEFSNSFIREELKQTAHS